MIKIKLLPLKYNVFTRDIMCNDKWFYNLYGEKNISEARNNPFILHYITSKKPWNSSSIAFSEIWWKYVKMQDNITHREYIKPFLMKYKIIAFNKILLKLKEMIKRLLKHLLFYDFIKERAKKIFNRLKK